MNFIEQLNALKKQYLVINSECTALNSQKQKEFIKFQTTHGLIDNTLPSASSDLMSIVLYKSWIEVRKLIQNKIGDAFLGMGQEWFNRTFLQMYFPPELNEENFNYLVTELNKVLTITVEAKKVMSLELLSEKGIARPEAIAPIQKYLNLHLFLECIEYPLDGEREAFSNPSIQIDLDSKPLVWNDFKFDGNHYEFLDSERLKLLRHIH